MLLRQLVSRLPQRTELGHRYMYIFTHIFSYAYTHRPISFSLHLFLAMYRH